MIPWVLGTLACAVPDDTVWDDEWQFRGDDGDVIQTPPNPPGGFINNGLDDPDVGGIDPAHGLHTVDGLDGAHLSDSGRLATARYVVECALSSDQTVTKTVDGEPVDFHGALGLAPEWYDEPCDQSCQEWVSACVLARTNVSGQTVSLHLRGEHPALGTTPDPGHPHYEANFFGNLFLSDDEAYMCQGTLIGSVLAQLDGRTCSNLLGGYCGFTTYGGCMVPPLSSRCDFVRPVSPTAIDCMKGISPGGAPLHTITTYVETPLL
ncbi:hypothetical protein [Paraliomyxa miuraensis]|uniref:hypothetical protein n=1 Tax=Paraliomyxa miuraensis TaxID=376150 RepID=UPI002255BB8E|nr:hypothetical protein [Paraliomyxa miuraensis]MCX4243348.1 hypothetical protein [Paraliomyxa miuraensis]